MIYCLRGMFLWQKNSDFAIYKYSGTSTNGHVSRTALFFSGQSIHSLLLKPLYNGHLSSTATSSMVTSQLWPPLYNSHLSTTAIFVADSPYIHSCFNLSTTTTSVQWPPLYNDHLSTAASSLQRSPLYNGHFCGRQSIHSLLLQPLYNDHLCTMATSLQRPPLHSGLLSSTVTSLQRPFFCTQSIHSLYCFNLVHFLLSPVWPL